jgi:hypothetical protein
MLMTVTEPYSFRLNVLTSETTIWLGKDGFQVLAKDGVSRTFSYDQVTKVRLSYEPSRAVSDLYICRIHVDGQSAPVATVSSTFYRGFLSFDPQLEAYRAFVGALHGKLAGRARVTYRAGVSNLAYWGNAVFLTVVAVFSALLLGPIIAEVTVGPWQWLKIALIAFLLPLAAAWFWVNRPRGYDPAAIPTELLPSPSGD